VAGWIAVAESAALAVGGVVEISCRDEDLLLYRDADGNCHAVTAYCPHLKNYMPNGLIPGAGLEKLLTEDELQCPYHGWRFNAEGQCTHIPQGQRVPPVVRAGKPILRRWAVREAEGDIEIGQLLP
jgi:phenylpropionate dioxygenase-like ring-hydroxylating dioxygenase large terminal subunit